MSSSPSSSSKVLIQNYRLTAIKQDDDEITNFIPPPFPKKDPSRQNKIVDDEEEKYYYYVTSYYLSFASYLNILTSCVSLTFAQSVAAPIERMKIVMQCQYALQQGGVIRGLPFETIRGTAKRLWEYEGAESLWRGNAVNVVRSIPTSIILWLKVGDPLYFGPNNDNLRKKNNSNNHNSSNPSSPPSLQRQIIWFLRNWFFATAASALFLTLVYPMEFLRVALAADVVTAPNTAYLRVGVRSFPASHGGLGSSWTCYRDCVRHVCERGLPGGLGLYSGFGCSVASLAIYRAAFLLLHSKMQYLLLLSSSSIFATNGGDMKRKRNFFVEFSSAWVVCTCAGMIAYPLDTLSKWCVVDMALSKKNVVENNSDLFHHRPNPKAIARNAFKIGGIRIFYHGAMVNVMRNAVVMGCLHLGILDKVAKML